MQLQGFENSFETFGEWSEVFDAPVSSAAASIPIVGHVPEGTYVATVRTTLFKKTGNDFNEIASAVTSAVVSLFETHYAAAGLALPDRPALIPVVC